MDLKDLIKDIDYQKEFDYEKRVDLFNKYTYSTTHDFFVPIFELACYVDNLINFNKNGAHNFGHGQTILNTSLLNNIKSGKDKRIELKDNVILIFLGGSRGYRIGFNLKSKTIRYAPKAIGDNSYFSVGIPRDLYEKIDEWLVDLGFDNW